MDTTPTSGSLCSGILGLDVAVAAHYGTEMAWYSEVEPAACSVIEREHPAAPNLGDLTTLDWSAVPPVDVLTAGYPCQPFSQAGRRKGTDDVRHLWPHIAEAVRVLRPRRVVLENVAGHLSLGFDVVLRDLAAAGFDAEWCVLRASDVGAPHQRARVFVVATPADTSSASPWRDSRSLPRAEAPCRRNPSRDGSSDGPWPASRWGPYWPAVEQWSGIIGRPPPVPLDGRGRLTPEFAEWMMGYPAGWTDTMAMSSRIRVLGNAVVPRQAEVALSVLDGGAFHL